MLLCGEACGDLNRRTQLGVHAPAGGAGPGRVGIEELGPEARSRLGGGQEAVYPSGDRPALHFLDLGQGQELCLRRVREVQALDDHRGQVRRHPEYPVGLGTGFAEACRRPLVGRVHPRNPERGEGRLDLLEQDAGQPGRLRIVDLVEGLGPRRVGASDRPTVVVDRHEGLRVQGVCDGGPLADRHVQVTASGERHRVAEVLESELGVEGHHEVEVPFGQAVGPDRSRLRPAVPGVEHHVDRPVRASAVVDDLVATGRADDRPARKPREDRQDHLVGSQDGAVERCSRADSGCDDSHDDARRDQQKTGRGGFLGSGHGWTVRHDGVGPVHRAPDAWRPPAGTGGRHGQWGSGGA